MRVAGSTEDIKKKAESDLFFFAQLVSPTRIYGQVHEDVFKWLADPKAKSSQMVLLPRAHQKSHMMAVWCCWWITKHPETTILYTSATERLAIAQMYAIKGILESEGYNRFWPEMIKPEEGKREKWTAKEIMVDHPKRKELGVRDATVTVASVGSTTTGLHCDVFVPDDLVVPENAYSQTGREAVSASYAQFSSVLNPDGITKGCGTRYHPRDLYSTFKDEVYELYNDIGEQTGEEIAWDFFEKVVEIDQVFLWPRSQHPVTKRWEGFDLQVLAKKRAKYFATGEHAQYYAQYYNDPNDPNSDRINADSFQYYEQSHLNQIRGDWFFKDRKLNIYAAMDVAFTESRMSDYTAIAVVGIDTDGYIYILDLKRFRTSKNSVFYDEIADLHRKWEFKRLRIESNAGANLMCGYLTDELRRSGSPLIIDAKHTSSRAGAKLDRIAAVLEPRYESQTIWHYRSGLNAALEDEIMKERPEHDDLKDALSAAIEISKPPGRKYRTASVRENIVYHPRFGGRVK